MDPVKTNGWVPMQSGKNRLLDLFRQEKGRFLAFAQRQLRGLSSLDPEDVVSEVFHTLLDRGDLVGETEHLMAYVYKSLGNRVLDVRRREARVPAAAEVDLERLADPGPDPLTAFSDRQIQERLAQALDTLSPKERAVWLATEMDGQSFRTLSSRWGEPAGTLLSRKSRATAKLRKQLADLHPDRS
jgi:RNA polymerase sigma factor (sigma-70 family)